MAWKKTIWFRTVVGVVAVVLVANSLLAVAMTLGFRALAPATVLLAVGTTTVAALALLFLVTRALLRPVSRVVAMAERVVDGDLSARTGLEPPGEMGALCRAVDRMAEAAQQREGKLTAAAQERLGQSARLAAVGKLAAGVAHEVNNPLTGVLTFAHLIREKANHDDEDRQALEVIIRETTRVREIVRGLLDFAREAPVLMRVIELGEVVRQVLELVRRQKEFRSLTIVERFHGERLMVWGDRGKLQQVFLNLVVNAAQAMPDGGTLTIATAPRDGGRKAAVAIGDTGCGIPADIRARIFEPFFTTKPIGSGTGLGLSITRGIVEAHKGSIELETAEGKGTTFTVVLPVAEQDKPAGPAAGEHAAKADGP